MNKKKRTLSEIRTGKQTAERFVYTSVHPRDHEYDDYACRGGPARGAEHFHVGASRYFPG